MVRGAGGLVAPLGLALALVIGRQAITARGQPRSPTAVGNDACAPCHKAIYDSYATTAMARTSGPAAGNLIEGSFHHAESDVSYRVFREGGTARLSYDRSGAPALHGSQELKYFVGSNTRGRTFLFDIDGFLYQSPVNYYTAKGVWDMSPGYAHLHRMELNHPVDATCLFCHSSRIQAPVEGTVNEFAGEPFLQPGVGCERCHGPGSEHVAGRGAMVNPAKLTSARRDDICMACHLEGVARIERAGHHEVEFQPGDTLSDVLAIFVRQQASKRALGAVSQFEALELSACKRRSHDTLTCITCHDPHVRVTASSKPEYYRAKCVGCHAPKAETHHPEQRDCTACHMPRLDSADIGHTMVTDHRIVRTEHLAARRATDTSAITEFGNPKPDERDLGLAYGEVALRGEAPAAQEAFRLLEDTLHSHPADADVLTRLGYLSQMQGDLDQAERFYRQALARDPERAVVETNLGVLDVRRGSLTAALALWRTAFDKNPQLTELGINLGRGLCQVGDAVGARKVVERALAHNPDSDVARQVLPTLTDTACTRH